MVLGQQRMGWPPQRTATAVAQGPFDGAGAFVFFTHYESRKANEIAAHPADGEPVLFPFGMGWSARWRSWAGRADQRSWPNSLSYFPLAVRSVKPAGGGLGCRQHSTVIGFAAHPRKPMEA